MFITSHNAPAIHRTCVIEPSMWPGLPQVSVDQQLGCLPIEQKVIGSIPVGDFPLSRAGDMMNITYMYYS